MGGDALGRLSREELLEVTRRQQEDLADREAAAKSVQRLSTPGKIAEVFLASKPSAWVAGHFLVADNGFSYRPSENFWRSSARRPSLAHWRLLDHTQEPAMPPVSIRITTTTRKQLEL